MPIKTLKVAFAGNGSLLMNNPQTVDPFNKYALAKKRITNKKNNKTEDDLLELRNIEVRSKLYFDEVLGVYVPSSWVIAALAKTSWEVGKIGKGKLRGGVYETETKLKLTYRDMAKVKTATDIVGNPDFRHLMLLPQKGVRIAKATPIFHDWGFGTTLEFDDKVIDPSTLKMILIHLAKYGGFGDFRPTFGRGTAEVMYD